MAVSTSIDAFIATSKRVHEEIAADMEALIALLATCNEEAPGMQITPGEEDRAHHNEKTTEIEEVGGDE
jgi:hypothetical protein